MVNLSDRFSKPGAKHILSLDGGGIRGALTIGYLKRIETILREKSENPDTFRLSDYFDLIGGTSTGALIATFLSLGNTVEEIKDIYMDLGGKIFGKKRNWWNPLETFKYVKAEFSKVALEDFLKKYFGTTTLGSREVKTGLCIVSKRADTNSTWLLINHPGGKYYETNKNIPLWQALRASTAAPSYFIPQEVDVGEGEIGAFVDGGVSMANNPALSLLMVATMKGFPFHWKTGEENISLVSVGTGYSVFRKRTDQIDDAWLLSWAKNVPEMIMQDASWQNQAILQWLSRSPTAVTIDQEIGNMSGDLICNKPLITYLRYNLELTQNSLNGLGMDRYFSEKDVADLIEMSHAHNRNLLYEIGVQASGSINPDHFN
jgi:patatin-like phospholipase/acyl hydrolase